MGNCCACDREIANDKMTFVAPEKVKKFHTNFRDAILTKSTRYAEALNYELINKELSLEDSQEQTALSELT